ncbi:MAG: class I SAM-dependent methyltransferase [Epsilonproteobacteria bacterium]|nr:MAG: class I SAM-dependent methyltransferase [Campylobacterota bacterium]
MNQGHIMNNTEIISTKNGYNIIDDKEKGYIHVSPIPEQEDLEKIYAEEYYTEEKEDYIDNTMKDLDWWETIYNDKYEIFNKYITAKDKKMLDIGCGSGYFMKYGNEIGWDCYGIEPSKKASDHAKSNSLNVLNQSFKNDLFENEQFDVVHMNQVLEHIAEPEKMLSGIHNIIKEDGLLCISVPNDFSPFQDLLTKDLDYNKWWLAPPYHLNYFTVKTLKTLIENHGFEVVLEEATFPMELFLLMDENYIDKPELGREVHQKRKLFDIRLSKYDNDLKRKLYQSLAKLNIGRHIILYAKKVSK